MAITTVFFVLACPFGTIFPDVLNYVSAKCDVCLKQLKQDENYIPTCVKTAPREAFQMVQLNEESEDIHFVGENLAVKNPSWRRKEEQAWA